MRSNRFVFFCLSFFRPGSYSIAVGKLFINYIEKAGWLTGSNFTPGLKVDWFLLIFFDLRKRQLSIFGRLIYFSSIFLIDNVLHGGLLFRKNWN